MVAEGRFAESPAVAFRWLKLGVEPGGACSLACLLNGQIAAEGRTVGIVLSGGNVDPALYARVLAGEL